MFRASDLIPPPSITQERQVFRNLDKYFQCVNICHDLGPGSCFVVYCLTLKQALSQGSSGHKFAEKCFGIEYIGAEKSCAIIPPGETLGDLKQAPRKEDEMHTTAIRGECFEPSAQAKTSRCICNVGSQTFG